MTERRGFVPFDAPVVGGEAFPDATPEMVEHLRRRAGTIVEPAYRLTDEQMRQALRDQELGQALGRAAVDKALKRLLSE